ncbi:MAG: hypothetical protein IPH84_11270, partial [Bacteroidales bacterium]|nr:hypothetical protein [Bacteroidales bacterium]
MKKFTRLAVLTAFTFLLCFQMNGWGQLLVEEFDYTAGTLLTANGWTAHSSANSQAITVNNGGLTFPGYLSSGIGNAALVDNTGEDVNKGFSAVSSGAVYVGFLVNVTTNSAGYFFNLGGSTIGTTFRGKVFTDASNHFGVSVGSNTGTFASSTFTTGTTYLLVLKYEVVSGSTNDKVSLFIFDSSIPASEPVSPSVGPLTDAAQSDITPGTVALRQYSATQNFLIDGIRVGTSWSAIAGASAPSWTSGYPKAENTTPSGFTAKVSISAAGTSYYVILPNGASAPTSAQVKAGQDATGTAVASGMAGTIACAAASTEYTSAVSGL